MLETAELGQTLDKATFEAESDRLRNALLGAQVALRDRGFAVVALFAGVPKAGSGETVNLLNEWMDPRWISTRAFGPPREEARERPTFWRYWTALPPDGRVGLFNDAWYQPLLDGRLDGTLDDLAFESGLEAVTAFERTLTDDGLLLIKFWMHLGAEQQRRRLDQLSADPLTAWRVGAHDRHVLRHHGALVAAAEAMIQRTSRAAAPWEVVEGTCERFRSVQVGRLLLAALERHLAHHPPRTAGPAPTSALRRHHADPKPSGRLRTAPPAVAHLGPTPPLVGAGGERPKAAKGKKAAEAEVHHDAHGKGHKDDHAKSHKDHHGKGHKDDHGKGKKGRAARAAAEAERAAHPRARTVLDALVMPTHEMPKEAYTVALEQAQGRLHRLQRRAQAAGVATVVALEGWDAAGKGGAIRRITRALDARHYTVLPIAAPTEEERAHHYLWRFWRHVPSDGRVTLFDRTWYGRVLVERVEGFASEPEWRRAYAEINQFEQHLIDHGIVLVKAFLHITDEEQKRRFEERQRTPHKQWKVTDEDWRNRARAAEYTEAIHDMVSRTSTERARWHLVPANDKRFARVRLLDLLSDALEARLGASLERTTAGPRPLPQEGPPAVAAPAAPAPAHPRNNP